MNKKPIAYLRMTGDRVTRISLEKVWDNDIALYAQDLIDEYEAMIATLDQQ